MMSSQTDVSDVRKALFITSPVVDINEKIDNTAKTLNNRLQIEHETDVTLKNAQRDGHEQRMKKFRQIAKRLPEDDWLYQPIEQLIGLK